MAETEEPGLTETEEDDPGHVARVYKYRVLGDLPQAGLDELARMQALASQLVTLEEAHEQAVAAVWEKYPEVADATDAVDAARERVAELSERASAERRRLGQRRVSKELRDQVKAAKAELRTAKEALRDRKDHMYEHAKDEFDVVHRRHREAVFATYGPSVAEGMYWANFNEVKQRHYNAVRAVRARRNAGQRAQLRRSWRPGEGTLAVQPQRRPLKGDPPRTPAMLASPTSKWRNTVALVPVTDPQEWALLVRQAMGHDPQWRGATVPPQAVDGGPPQSLRPQRWARLRFRVGAGDCAQELELPVLVSRPLPADAEIVLVRVSRRVTVGNPTVDVSFTCRLPAPEPRQLGLTVAAHLGWRALPDGALRVAVVTGAGPVPKHLRDELRDIVRFHGEGWHEVVIPVAWRETMAHLQWLQSRRSRRLDELKSWLLGWLDDHPRYAWLDELGCTAAEIAQWRSPARFVWLARRIHAVVEAMGLRLIELLAQRRLPLDPIDQVPIDQVQVFGPHVEVLRELDQELWTWRRRDKKLALWRAHRYERLRLQRRNAWYCVAAWLTTEAAAVRLDEWKVTAVTRAPAVEDADDMQAQRARANRVLAAPGELRSLIAQTARREGVAVEKPPGSKKSVHFTCCQSLDLSEAADSIRVPCNTCGVMVDQDLNAAQWLGA